MKHFCVIKKTITVATATQTLNTMKKLIAMAIAILITAGITAFATDKKPGMISQKQFDYQIRFSRIVVADDIDVELKESNNKIIDVSGEEASIENVSWKIKDDVLYLKSKKGSLKEKVKVTINVSELKELFIKGKSTVRSSGHLSSPALHVYMEDDCVVSIKNVGQIYVINGYDTEIDVKKIVGDVQVGR